ncbi:uncharacterized protein EI90DRAFT_2912761 [Cantharellus anzutake]|uniref:uncharacterized protein n=1 Tax=Cantharellus anzutake TaxID=1750568 RepID=UPI0019065F24|nr:uncharacterized protein EI90DRAFT_2912761 [Cantharellus anzutake]KAF8335780.1 hypothetical protein EI90DRAFT_2912761 [Cantharellus anzutake]
MFELFFRANFITTDPKGRGTSRGTPRGRGRGAPHIPGGPAPSGDKLKRDILDLSKYQNQPVRVRFTGGREVTGVVKGWNNNLDLVLDDVEEVVSEAAPRPRRLGFVICRGSTVVIVSPLDGSAEIENPFIAQDS